MLGPDRLASLIAGSVVPTRAGGGVVAPLTFPPVRIDTTTISAMAIAAPMPRETNIMGDGWPRPGRETGSVVSDKDINRHEDKEGRQVRNGEVKETHRLGDVGLVLSRVAIEAQGVEGAHGAQFRRREGVDPPQVGDR